MTRLRRAAVTAAYLVLLFVIYALAVRALDPTRRHIIDAVALLWLAVSTATIVAAIKGVLPGARRVRSTK
jgi:hypothetical protein